MTRAVLFDMDGTLLTLDVDIAAVRAELAAFFGPRGFAGEFRPVLDAIDAAATATADRDRDAHSLRGHGRGIIDAAEVAAGHRARERAGAGATLASLLAAGIPVGLVTDNGRACVEPAFAAAGLCAPNALATVVTRDDVPRPKPDPAGVVRAARALLPEGGTLWFVGDSPKDAAAARAANAALPDIDIAFAGITGGRGSADDLAGADAVISRVAEVLALRDNG